MEHLPAIINQSVDIKSKFPLLVSREFEYINEAQGLFNSGYYSYSLLAIWNAAINNLKRKVEAYSAELWESIVKDEPGRKKFKKDGETISERWSDVDDLVLITGATRLGLMNPKAGKALEMINWMRNHASPAHDSDNKVEKEDVLGLVIILQKNLFEQPIPDAGFSVNAVFEPVKKNEHTDDQIEVLNDQIKSFRAQDVRIAFGFFSDLLSKGEEPALTNVKKLFPTLWEMANDELKKTLGVKYHTLLINPDSDESPDKGAKTRLFEFLIEVSGVGFIPDGTRAKIYRKAAKDLRKAKNTSYGWGDEESAAQTLAQMGRNIPSIVFEEVYQEILPVYCGNYWGRSSAYKYLDEFIDQLNSDQIRTVLKMFRENVSVQDELSQRRPKAQAIALLNSFLPKLTIAAHKQVLKDTIDHVKAI